MGPVKQRDRGFGAGELLTGIAAAQLAGGAWWAWTACPPMRPGSIWPSFAESIIRI